MDADIQFEELELIENAIVPGSWDWRDHKAVTAVKN